MRSSLFTLRYLPRTQIPPVASRYLGSPTHSIYPKIAHMYATRDRTVLWWRVSAQHLMVYKRVVRTWCSRKMRIAFKQALKTHGFDAEGKRITSAPRPSAGWISGDDDRLTGTVEITINPRFIREDMSNLQSDMDQTVRNLLERQALEKRPGQAILGKKSKWVDLTPCTQE